MLLSYHKEAYLVIRIRDINKIQLFRTENTCIRGLKTSE